MSTSPNNMGGFRRVEICAATGVQSITVTGTGSARLTLADGTSLLDLPLSDNTASLTTEPKLGSSGTSWTHSASLSLPWRLNIDYRDEMLQTLLDCCTCGCIVVGTDYDGRRVLLGDTAYPLRGTLTEAWGSARTSLRHWQLELSATELHPAFLLES